MMFGRIRNAAAPICDAWTVVHGVCVLLLGRGLTLQPTDDGLTVQIVDEALNIVRLMVRKD